MNNTPDAVKVYLIPIIGGVPVPNVDDEGRIERDAPFIIMPAPADCRVYFLSDNTVSLPMALKEAQEEITFGPKHFEYAHRWGYLL